MILTNEEIVEQIQQGINVQKNMTALYEQTKKFIYMIVKPFMKYAEPDDLLQEGFLGLYEAAYSYRPGQAKFITYLPYRIRKCCIRYLENNSNTKRIPSHRLNEIRIFKHFCQKYSNEHGHYPDDKTIMQELELSEAKLNNIRKVIYEQNCISIHSVAPGAEDAALEDIIADPSNMEEDVEEKMFQEYERQVLDDAIKNLPEREAEIVQDRYFKNKTLAVIADEKRLSKERVRQLQNKALGRLRKSDKLQELYNEIYGYDSSVAYKMSRKYCLDRRTSTTETLALKRVMLEEQQKSLAKDIGDIFAELLEV